MDREIILAELRQAFDATQADVLLRVMERVATNGGGAAATREDFRELKEVMSQLAAAQQRTEVAVERLAEAQQQTEQQMARLSRQVGGLSDTVGGDIEDIAYIVLHEVLKREFGWDVGVLERTWRTWNGVFEEVDVFGQANVPSEPGRVVWIVGEAKHNLTMREVEKFANKVERIRRGLTGEVFPVCFCYRARPEVQEFVRAAGIRLVFSYGKMA